MLERLQISNYVLIDSLDIRFPGGLVIITGATGAGKSILLGALSLALGSKADASVVGGRGDSCVVEAEFRVGGDERITEILDQEEIEPCEDGVLTLRRVVFRSGRSRSFVNDLPATSTVLASLSPLLMDIHTQHQTLRLKDGGFRLSILDAFSDNAGLLSLSSKAWKALSAKRRELEEARNRLSALLRDRDYNQARLSRLEEAGLREGEVEELEAEQKLLSNAESVKEALQAVTDALSGGSAGVDTVSSLKDASRRLQRVEPFVVEAGTLSERIDAVRIELADILSEVNAVDEGIDLSPGRLAEVEERLSELYSLMSKYSCRNVSELIAQRDALSGLLFDTSSLSDRISVLEGEVKAASEEYGKAASALSKSRLSHAEAFEKELIASLEFLELQNSSFKVDLSEAQPSASGTDAVEFMFAPAGQKPSPLSDCASGGELSRIMLSLKALMAGHSRMPSLFFDEIDTGVSGSAADRMGSMICAMGADMQVFAITHLPQVAAKGSAHYVVSKQLGQDGVASTTVSAVEGEERVFEVARLLSGEKVGEAAVANARALMGEGPTS